VLGAVMVVVEHGEHLALCPRNQVGSPCETFSWASGSARQMRRSRAMSCAGEGRFAGMTGLYAAGCAR
jgi:hypothetical protein